jgi:deoxyribose-phosphate aldolase
VNRLNRISEIENRKLVVNCIQEAIDENFKLVMIRPEMVSLAKKMVTDQKSKVNIGTVIDFPKGNSNYSKKIKEAKLELLSEIIGPSKAQILKEAFAKREA